MNVTGVGSSYHFIYNTKTGKLSTKDGSKNEFVDFCNGDVKGEDTETLNYFDVHTRYQFERMLYVYGTGMTGQNPFTDAEKVEITANIDSATHTSFYVNGQKTFTAITGMTYLPSEIQTFGTIQQPFKTRGYQPYDPETNSITIGIGSRFDLGNGYSVTVQEDCVWGEGYGKGSQADDERCNMMVGGLSSLIHFADQQYFSSMTDPYIDYILDFLSSQGVDTRKEFVINGTHCELVNGKINEVGNDYVVPSSIQAVAVKRYIKKMSELLKDGNWYRRNYDKQHTNETQTKEPETNTNTYHYLDSNGMTVYAKDGTSLAEKALIDQRYTEKETGISWFVGDDGKPYMVGDDVEKFNEMCRENGEDPINKFAEMTGMIQSTASM